MKITCDRRELAEALKWVASAIDKRPTTPAMGGVRVTVDESTLTLTAWNYTSAHTVALPALGAEPGEALIPGPALTTLVGSMRGQEVTLAATGATCEITSGAAAYSLRCLNLHDYTTPPSPPQPIGVVSGASLAEAVRTVAAFADRTGIEATAALEQVRIEAADGALVLAATNRSTLVTDSVGYDGEPFTLGLPADLLAAAVTGLSSEGSVQIAVSDGMVALTGDGRTVSIRRVDLEFPAQWRRLTVAPDTAEAFTVDAGELAAAMKRISTLVEGETAVRFTLDADQAALAAVGQTGEGVDSVPVEEAGAPMRSAFGPRVLGSALGAFDGPISVTYVPGEQYKAPIFISADTQPNRIAVVMPRRITGGN